MSFRFGDFELDQERRQLLRSGRPVLLEPKAYELLSVLLERRPRALSRAQIRDAIWAGSSISESTLGGVVTSIRQALDDDSRHPRFIRTVHGFGYAFCGEAREGERVRGGPPRSPSREDVEERGPYPGLHPFVETDAGVFFGREREVSALWETLAHGSFLAVIGPSGAGKTSFVQAGVVAARPEGCATLVCTPGTAPTRSLARALAPELAGDPEALAALPDSQDPDVVESLVQRWRRDHAEALLVVDQFEELFTLNPPEVQGQFRGFAGPPRQRPPSPRAGVGARRLSHPMPRASGPEPDLQGPDAPPSPRWRTAPPRARGAREAVRLPLRGPGAGGGDGPGGRGGARAAFAAGLRGVASVGETGSGKQDTHTQGV